MCVRPLRCGSAVFSLNFYDHLEAFYFERLECKRFCKAWLAAADWPGLQATAQRRQSTQLLGLLFSVGTGFGPRRRRRRRDQSISLRRLLGRFGSALSQTRGQKAWSVFCLGAVHRDRATSFLLYLFENKLHCWIKRRHKTTCVKNYIIL